jgi:hypothetical protein
MKKLPKVNSNFLIPLSKVAGEGSKVFVNSCKQLSPHVKLVFAIVVDDVAKKSEYAPDIVAVKSKTSAPMPVVAKLFKMSPSYAYKLNKK